MQITQDQSRLGPYSIGHRFGCLWIIIGSEQKLIATAVVTPYRAKPLTSIAGRPEPKRKDHRKRAAAIRAKRAERYQQKERP